MKCTSAINSFPYIAAFLSFNVDLVACQLGSFVDIAGDISLCFLDPLDREGITGEVGALLVGAVTT